MIRDAELKLLVKLCAAAIRGEQAGDIGDDHDWSRVLGLARRHRVQGLAWLGLSGEAESELPQAVELFEDTKAIAHENLLAVAAAARLRDEFSKRALQIVFLKGLTLGALAYPQAMLKMSTDVDVLINPAEIVPAEQCLENLGYEPEGLRRSASRRAALAKEWVWNGSDGVVLDLHARLADNPALLSTIDASSRTQGVEVSPGIILPTLPREELFAYLCVHGTSSAWFRLKWAADLAAFLRGCPAVEIEQLYQASRALGAGRCPDVASLIVEDLFGPLVPEDVLSEARRDPLSRLLAGLSLREFAKVREPLERPLGTLSIHVAQMFMGRGFAFPLQELRRQFSTIVGA